jgi:outer membrane protein TolC
MSKNKLLLLLLVLGFGASSHTQTMKLEAILDSVKASHPVVKMYQHEIRSMDEAAKGARSWMPPQFGLGQFMTPYNVKLWQKEGIHSDGMGSVMLSGEQMFSSKKKLDANERYMTAMSSVEKEKLNASLNDLLGDAKQAYFELIILRKKMKILDQNEKLLNFMIRNAEIRYKNGLEKISAYYKAKAALGNLQNMRLMFDNDIKEKFVRLNVLMGKNAVREFEIDTTYQLKDYAEVFFDSTLFYSQRSDLKALDKDINLIRLKSETEKQNLKPQFGIRYDHMIGFGAQPMLYTIMGMVKVPMAKWSAKMSQANIESLKWKVNALQAQKEMMANEYSGMAQSMRNEMELKKRQLKLYDDNIIPALKNNVKTMQLGYEQNTEELFMLYDAWERLYMTQLDYTEILNQALKMQVNLERIMETK